MKKTFALLMLFCTLGVAAQQKMVDKPFNILPELKLNVNDTEKLMTEAQQKDLAVTLNSIGSAKIIVFTTPDAGFYETFDDFLLDVCLKNHLDSAENDYVLIAVSKGLMEIKILCSKSLKAKFSGQAVQSLLDNEMIPEFREGRFFEGIQKTALSIQKML